MRYVLDEQQCRNLDVSSHREWLLTNGIGGYAMGTASGINTRRYHAHLIAATTPPTGRMVLLASVDAFVQSGPNALGISANQYPGAIYPDGYHNLRRFTVDGEATWRYRAGGHEVVKRLTMHPETNAVTVSYENVGSTSLRLTLRPLVCHRDHHGDFFESADYPEHLMFPASETVVESNGISLHLNHPGANRTPVQGWYFRFEHAREQDRGLNYRGDLFCPCELQYDLRPGEKAFLVAATEANVDPLVLGEEEAPREFRLTPLLKEAANHFFVSTGTRSSIIAGYPWFTDWGRDTMISIPGLCLHTGNVKLAKEILSAYASQLKNGLIPNRFGEVGETPDYNTVDATLWFANAIYKTLLAEWDLEFARAMLITLENIYLHHMEGTDFGIGVDINDGLLRQGEPGVQLTWMDAKVGDWVITPRHGKPVEINGLWINALRCMEWLATKLEGHVEVAIPAATYATAATRAEASFEAKFWHEVRGHYLDTVDPADASLRPNQVLAMALPFSPVNPEHARLALDVVTRELLTPVGLRTLGPKEPGYRGSFKGNMAELDAAYHQGTVWPWLLGSYATALVKFKGDRAEAKRVLKNARQMLEDYGLGGIAEVYDGDEPQMAAGCPWQAWSLAEILRAWSEDIGGD